jgi:hypothetical protein
MCAVAAAAEAEAIVPGNVLLLLLLVVVAEDDDDETTDDGVGDDGAMDAKDDGVKPKVSIVKLLSSASNVTMIEAKYVWILS